MGGTLCIQMSTKRYLHTLSIRKGTRIYQTERIIDITDSIDLEPCAVWAKVIGNVK